MAVGRRKWEGCGYVRGLGRSCGGPRAADVRDALDAVATVRIDGAGGSSCAMVAVGAMAPVLSEKRIGQAAAESYGQRRRSTRRDDERSYRG